MEVRYNSFSSEVFIDMPYKEARVFLTALDNVRNHTADSVQCKIVADFVYKFGRLLQDI